VLPSIWPVAFLDFLGAELASVNFASDLSGTRPAWLHACALEYLLANGKELLCGFARSQGEATRLWGYVPILDISW
jgi:hypothetical protein